MRNRFGFRGFRCLAVGFAIQVAATTGASPVSAQCVGDCGADGAVTVDELVRAVNIALGTGSLSECGVADSNGDSMVTVDELVRAVNNALNGCPPEPTATASATETATEVPVDTDTPEATSTPTEVPADTATATETATEGSTATPTEVAGTATDTVVPADTETPTPSPSGTETSIPTHTPTMPSTNAGENVAGRAAVVANGVNSLANVISGIVVTVNGVTSQVLIRPSTGGEAATLGGGGDVDQCPIAGTTSQDCSANAGTLTLSLGAQMCLANGPLGGTALFDGNVSLVGAGLLCPLLTAGDFDIDLQVVLNNGIVDVLNVESDLSGNASLGIGGSCLVNSVQGTMNGTLSGVVANGSGTEITFDNTSFRFADVTFNSDCVPLVYSITFNGPATIREVASNESFAVTFTDFVMTQDAQSQPVTVNYSGTIASDCFGGSVALQTLVPVSVAAGQLCPNAGSISATSDATARISYLPDGSVSIDRNNDGIVDESYPSCTDPALLMCVN